jgi:hypothetical protein
MIADRLIVNSAIAENVSWLNGAVGGNVIRAQPQASFVRAVPGM